MVVRAGGLTGGATINMAPDLFLGAMLWLVPFVEMTTMLNHKYGSLTNLLLKERELW